MSNIDITKVASASFMPGLQNSGQVTGFITFDGTVKASPSPPTSTSNLTGIGLIPLPNPNVISSIIVNFPGFNGDLATKWFPLFGTCELTDLVLNVRIILYVGSYSGGRSISFNIVNLTTSDIQFVSMPIAYKAFLYTYPF